MTDVLVIGAGLSGLVAAIAAADAAAQQSDDLFLQALAAWHLGRAANDWFRPRRVQAAVQRARCGFQRLNETGWLAACDWQLHAVPWLWPDFQHGVNRLESALTGLQKANFAELIPECRLSLAFAYLLVGNFAAAAAQTDQAETGFQKMQNQIGIGRCLYTRASIQRRRAELKPAAANTRRALDIFRKNNAPVHAAMAQYGLGHIAWLLQNDFVAAEAHFQQALTVFTASDLPLWAAQCQNGLAQVYTYSGQLAGADRALQFARQTYERYRIPGLWADNLLDSGRLASFKGEYPASLSFLEQAETLYRETGNWWMPLVALMDQGEVCLRQGRYHESLRRLEKAYASLQELNLPLRQAECEWRLAEAWLRLGDVAQARAFLDKAVERYKQSNAFSHLIDGYNRRAEIAAQAGQWDEAISLLRKTIKIARRQEAHASLAAARRLLGETLYLAGKTAAALPHLQAARQQFAGMKMIIEESACELALGYCYRRMKNTLAAEVAWKRAIALSGDAAPEVEWRAQAGLAEIASGEAEALTRYRHALTALARLRRNLWQPTLTGSFWQKQPALTIDRAVSLAIRRRAILDALRFIEESKAQSIARRLAENRQTVPDFPEPLLELAAEIRWLQQELGKAGKPGGLIAALNRELYRKFTQKVKAYDSAVNRLERAATTSTVATGILRLETAQFQEEARAHLGENWLALDYYFTKQYIYAVIVGPEKQNVWRQKLSEADRFALSLVAKDRYGRAWAAGDLARLSRFLFPPVISPQITPDTYLLISPHRRLHRLPWAALPCGPEEQPLVTGCIPVVIPSLRSLLTLWQSRQFSQMAADQTGLLVAVSDFQGRHAPLPAVMREMENLQSLPEIHLRVLLDNQATLTNLFQLAAGGQLAQFAFLHLATHAFSDQITGRLSGLALYDDDLWLDELTQLAPLPPLVTLSACSGLNSLLYEGDERVGIASTCLAAGARMVIGSLWPVLDRAAPDLMRDFYQYRLASGNNARALALAQRAALAAGVNVRYWGGFQCVGRP